MFPLSIILLTFVFFQSCSTVKKLEIFKTEVEREPLNLNDPILSKLENISWIVITSENAKAVFEKMEQEGIDPVLIGLTDNEYKMFAKNFAHIRNNLKKKSEIINAYKEYYEGKND